MKITAFDFETCGATPLSAIELGLAVFEDSRLTETRSWRFFPAEPVFHRGAVQVNGIVREHVEGLPEFNSKWDEIRPYFVGDLVAHNAAFDVAVLCGLLDHFAFVRPNVAAHCTFQLSKSLFDRESYRLDSLCNDLRIPLLHHCSVSDAVATGHLLNCLAGQSGGMASFLNTVSRKIDVADWTTAARQQPWNSHEDEFSAAAVSISLADLGFESELGLSGDTASAGSYDMADVWSTFTDAVRHRDDLDQFLSGWRFAVSGDPFAGKRTVSSELRRLGGACEDGGKLLKTAKAGVPYAPANTLVVAEEMLSHVVSGRSPTGKLKSARDMRFGKRPKPIKLISEADLFLAISKGIERGDSVLRWDDYAEDSEIVRTMWAVLE